MDAFHLLSKSISIFYVWEVNDGFALSRFNNLLYKIGSFQKMKSILTFQKWTKINVQNRHVKNTLTENFFCLENEKLSSQIKPENFILLCYFFKKNN
jgi:hypothetical protein